MKTALIILTTLIACIIVLLLILGIISRSGTAPGLAQETLTKCPDKPNCVCSEYKEDHAHYTDPIHLPQGTSIEPLLLLKDIIQDMGGHIQTEHDDYLAATFHSAIFGFVDDLEIRLDPSKQLIHLRSGSRVGYSDGGVNKRRCELLKARFSARISPAHHN